MLIWNVHCDIERKERKRKVREREKHDIVVVGSVYCFPFAKAIQPCTLWWTERKEKKEEVSKITLNSFWFFSSHFNGDPMELPPFFFIVLLLFESFLHHHRFKLLNSQQISPFFFFAKTMAKVYMWDKRQWKKRKSFRFKRKGKGGKGLLLLSWNGRFEME